MEKYPPLDRSVTHVTHVTHVLVSGVARAGARGGGVIGSRVTCVTPGS